MKYKKVIALGILSAVLVSGGIYWINKDSHHDSVSIKLANDYMNDQDLLEKAQLIVEVSNIKNIRKIKYLDVDFLLSDAIVNDVIQGENISAGQTISILQTQLNDSDYPQLQLSGQYVLFLDEYIGPIASDAYVICGMDLGLFKKESGMIQLSKRQKQNFTILSDDSISTQNFKSNLMEAVRNAAIVK